MTECEAEEIYMAWQVGKDVQKSKVAQAVLILKARELRLEESPNAEGTK